MIRKIVKIDAEKCNGCGKCVSACHEGAIAIEGGKARLIRDDYCDGLGDCLPSCPMGAISFEEREAPDYDESAVQRNKMRKSESAQNFSRSNVIHNFPIQLKLIPSNAPFLQGTDLLIAADCTAFVNADFQRFMKDRAVMIGCPKLDNENYAKKLTEIFRANDIKTITVARMTVPCCGGLVHAVHTALSNCEKAIPVSLITISTNGDVVSEGVLL